jgi:hypothetical protein
MAPNQSTSTGASVIAVFGTESFEGTSLGATITGAKGIAVSDREIFEVIELEAVIVEMRGTLGIA